MLQSIMSNAVFLEPFNHDSLVVIRIMMVFIFRHILQFSSGVALKAVLVQFIHYNSLTGGIFAQNHGQCSFSPQTVLSDTT